MSGDIRNFEISRVETEHGTKVYFYVKKSGGFIVRSLTFSDKETLGFEPKEGEILPEFFQETEGYWDPIPQPEYLRDIA